MTAKLGGLQDGREAPNERRRKPTDACASRAPAECHQGVRGQKAGPLRGRRRLATGITDKGTKRWALRLTINGRRVERGLGVYPDVGLDEVREQAGRMRRAAKDGRDAPG